MGIDINTLVTIGAVSAGADNVGDALTAIGGDAIAAVSSEVPWAATTFDKVVFLVQKFAAL
jgi:hypothetical protein